MGTTIAQAKAGATAILGALPTNTFVGVGSYQGDCFEGGQPAGCYGDFYGTKEHTASTGDLGDAQDGSTSGPRCTAATIPRPASTRSHSVANNTSWRAGSQRLVVWFGDAPSHT